METFNENTTSKPVLNFLKVCVMLSRIVLVRDQPVKNFLERTSIEFVKRLVQKPAFCRAKDLAYRDMCLWTPEWWLKCIVVVGYHEYAGAW